MARNIQIRGVRPELHAELVRRSKLAGKTLTAYIEEILEREIERPPADEIFDRVKRRKPIPLGAPAAELIREEREEMERKWDRLWPTPRPSRSSSRRDPASRRTTKP